MLIPVHMEEETAKTYRSMSRQLRRIIGIIVRGLMHLALPEDEPMKICIVLEYPQSTVRHEFTP